MSSERAAPGKEPEVPLCVPEIRGKEWEYLKECLDTNSVSPVGSFVDRFERMLAGYVGAEHAVATVNGTAALHIALLVAGVEPDDEVLVSDLTFIAPANAIRYVGAWPVFIDAEPDYWQLDVDKLAGFIANGCRSENGRLVNKATGRRVTAILPVHILGHPCDMDPILDIARRHGLMVVEDASESLGAEYRGRKVGSQGDVVCFSFNGNKLVTCGAGGMIVTGSERLAQRARHLTTQAKDDPVEYTHSEIGYNYRLSNVQAAVGCAQLEDVDERVAAKRRIAGVYRDAFSAIDGITVMPEAAWASSARWMYTILVNERDYGLSSRGLLEWLGRKGIQARPLWQPLHLSEAHRGAYAHECSISTRIQGEALSLPSSVGLSPSGQSLVIQGVTEAALRPAAARG